MAASKKRVPGADQRAGLTIVRDPEVTIGGLRLLQRTDSDWIAVDEALPPGRRTVFRDPDRRVVERWMKDKAGGEHGTA